MNLYEFSQKHNREMGVLFRRTDEDSKEWDDYRTSRDDDSDFQDAIEEIRDLLNSSEFEKESFETKTLGFKMEIVKSKKELALEKCELINKFSRNKKFILFQEGEDWLCRCNNFVDGVDLIIENHRAILKLNFEEDRIVNLFKTLNTNRKKGFDDYRIVDCFRMFWTYPKSSPTLYPYTKHNLWTKDFRCEDFFEGYIKGLNEFFKILNKPELARTKK